MTGQPVTKELAREALGELLRHAVRVVRVADVDAAVVLGAEAAGRDAAVEVEGLGGEPRRGCWRSISPASTRRRPTARSAPTSANKTHSTAVAAEKKVRGWLASNEAVRAGDRAWKARDLLDKVERELQR